MNEIYMRIMYRGIRTVANYKCQGLVQYHLCKIYSEKINTRDAADKAICKLSTSIKMG